MDTHGAIRHDLQQVSWERVFENKDVSGMWEIFRDKVSGSCEKHVPLKKPHKKARSSWMSKVRDVEGNKEAGKKAWWRECKSFDSEDNYKKFKIFRNRVVKLIRRDKKTH